MEFWFAFLIMFVQFWPCVAALCIICDWHHACLQRTSFSFLHTPFLVLSELEFNDNA